MSLRVGSAVRAAVLSAAMIALACTPPDASERGFGSTLVSHARDAALSLRSFTLGESGIYLARTVPNVTVSTGVSPPYDRSLVPFDTGVEQPIAPGVLGALLLPSGDGLGRSLVMTHFTSDDVIPQTLSQGMLPFVDLTFLDEVTGAVIDISDVDSQSLDLGATVDDPIRVNRKNDAGKAWPWMGKPQSLVALPSGINQVVGRDRAGLLALTSSSDRSDTQAFIRFPFDGGPPVEIVPGILGDHPIVIDPARPPTPSAAPVRSTVPTSGVVPAVTCPRALAGDPSPGPCSLFYDRAQPSVSRVPFVHDLDAGTDVELPGKLVGPLANALRVSPTARDIFWTTEGSAVTTRLYSWHVGDTQAASCDIDGHPSSLSFGVSAWRPAAPAGAAFVVVAQPSSQSSENRASWTLVAGTAGGECHVVTRGANLINQLFYAPDGSALAFLEVDPIGVSKLYVSDGDGGLPRVVATGAYFFNIDFRDARHLVLWHSNTDGYSVSWLDVSTTPATEHPIADRVRWDARGSWAWINPRWVLLADADSTQDESFSLNVVDIETGSRKLVSSGVVDFRVPWSTAPDGATSLTVAYLVRSRVPSSQDGLWAAHLTLTDFPR